MQTAEQDLGELMRSAAEAVDKELDRIVPVAETDPADLHKAIRHSLFAGGKRFRPTLVIISGKTLGARSEHLVRTAAAIEMIHTYSLIHDDLPAMDDDELRRGKPTCHKIFGEATAILAGDVLQTLAFQAIAEDKELSPETRVRIIAEITKAAGTPNGMAAGQQFDLEAEGIGESAGIEELERIHHRKTGSLIRTSVKCGAIIAGADEDTIAAFSEFGGQLGLLFQITDDLLDVTETTETLGKTAGKDAFAAKLTYPAIFGVHKSRNMAMQVFASACEPLDRLQIPTDSLVSLAESILMRKK